MNTFVKCCLPENLDSSGVLRFSFSLSADEEEVGPWPGGPIVPFRKKALQRLGVSQVRSQVHLLLLCALVSHTVMMKMSKL